MASVLNDMVWLVASKSAGDAEEKHISNNKSEPNIIPRQKGS